MSHYLTYIILEVLKWYSWTVLFWFEKMNRRNINHDLGHVQYDVLRIAACFRMIWSFWHHWLLMSQHWDALRLCGELLWCDSSPSSLWWSYSAIKPWTAFRVLLLVWKVQDYLYVKMEGRLKLVDSFPFMSAHIGWLTIKECRNNFPMHAGWAHPWSVV